MSLFLSYSRREVTFADSLSDHLETLGYEVWVDFKSIPLGDDWQSAIDAGIDKADTFLLVVSSTALESPFVRHEWESALSQQKRLLLLIFEAAPLPAELADREWIDFRKSFDAALADLRQRLADTEAIAPTTLPSPRRIIPPTPRAFITLSRMKFAILLSCLPLLNFNAARETAQESLLLLISVVPLVVLVLAVTIFSGWIVPLPEWHLGESSVFRRAHNFGTTSLWLWIWLVGGAALITPFFSPFLDQRPLLTLYYQLLTVFYIVVVLAQQILLRRPGMYRWGTEKGVHVRSLERSGMTPARFVMLLIIIFLILAIILALSRGSGAFLLLYLVAAYLGWRAYRRHYEQGNTLNVTWSPNTFHIEYAHPDNFIAQQMAVRLTAAGHTWVRNPDEARTLIVLMSQYNTRSEKTPTALEKGHRIIPALVQPVESQVMETEPAYRFQALDLRSDIRARIELFARNFHELKRAPADLAIMPFKLNVRKPNIVRNAEAVFGIGVILGVLTTVAGPFLLYNQYRQATALMRDSPGMYTLDEGAILLSGIGIVVSLILVALQFNMRNMLIRRTGSVGEFRTLFGWFIGIIIIGLVTRILTGGAGIWFLMALAVGIFSSDEIHYWLPNE